VETFPCGFGASTNAQWLHSAPSSGTGFEASSSQIWINQCIGNGMMMDPNPHHPQHMKVVNHLSYVWKDCGNQFHVEFKPQPMHTGLIQRQAVTKGFWSYLPKFGLKLFW
jgi:hypothetical protein